MCLCILSYVYSRFICYNRASLACAVRMADTTSTRGVLWVPKLSLINHFRISLLMFRNYFYHDPNLSFPVLNS